MTDEHKPKKKKSKKAKKTQTLDIDEGPSQGDASGGGREETASAVH
eukprot:CAMPEP_0117076728 /NCGR_PEP_ID=MMETSP0472-20121206/54081_1 /TAXON_ID=693140 ORGANISM="Tiarina fusus, Strain LIS" /NCGR_SAMPLE_ID=MMETSP0472 /ASSEMBLY_ACC=CAM_ASM_000603 /LENGTH=45 /DNA_ID= /DNA_START= /DNA_END= /DNA_ORIENTATION=